MDWIMLSGRERLSTQCASAGCSDRPVATFQHDGIGSHYCPTCRAIIENAYIPTPKLKTGKIREA